MKSNKRNIAIIGTIVVVLVAIITVFANLSSRKNIAANMDKPVEESDQSNTAAGNGLINVTPKLNHKLGFFNTATDLFIDHHDTGADLDDVHCMGAVGTLLADDRFTGIQYYCVTGTVKRDYNGSKTDASEVLRLAYPDRWSDAYADWKGSVDAEAALIEATLEAGGDVWIAEGGSSDFTSDVIRKIKADIPAEDTNGRIHVIQHNAYNQDTLTTPGDLEYVKANTDYQKIQDGIGKFHTDRDSWWEPAMSDPKEGTLWKTVKALSDERNGKTDYTNPTIEKGGMAFSDFMETAYIFGFDSLPSVDAFFKEFLPSEKEKAFAVTPAPVAATAEGSFLFGINLNGDAVTIEGNPWRSYSDALNSGFSTSAPNTFSSDITWSPVADNDTNTMLNSVIYNSSADFTMTQTITNGNYEIYFWVAENYMDNARSIGIKLEGISADSGIGTMLKGTWVKYGPYHTTVSDGKLDMEFVSESGDPHVAGLAIYSGNSTQGALPVNNSIPTATSEPVKASEPTYASVPLTDPGLKNRLIVCTDIGSDPDDNESMVRLMLYSNDIDIEGLIAGSGCWKPTQGMTEVNMIRNIIDAYGEVRSNLTVHADGYPTKDYLLSVLKLGQSAYGMAGIGEGKDSDGSELIINAVDKDDPRPVWIAAWGGISTLAQALWKVEHTRTPEEVTKFVKKLRVYDIGGQDDTGAWITNTFPQLFYIRSVGQFYGMGTQGITDLVSADWLKENVQSHGPLGRVYPDVAWTLEGDTPSYLNLLPTGLSDPVLIDQGGWGGRFSTVKALNPRSTQNNGKIAEAKYDNYFMYTEAADDGNFQKPIFRWREGYQNDMAARMDWSVTDKYSDANHNPIAVANGNTSKEILQISTTAGSEVDLSAAGSDDPDGDELTYSWWYYKEPSTYHGIVTIENSTSESATVEIPDNCGGKTIQIILQIHDNGSPNLYAYRRIIIHVK